VEQRQPPFCDTCTRSTPSADAPFRSGERGTPASVAALSGLGRRRRRAEGVAGEEGVEDEGQCNLQQNQWIFNLKKTV